MKYVLKLLIGLFCFTSAFSQAEFVNYIDYTNTVAAGYLRLDGENVFDASDVEGTLYLNEEISNSEVIDKVIKNKFGSFLKYDVYNDFFNVKIGSDDEDIKPLKRTPRFEFIIDGERFILIETELLNVAHYNAGNGYVVELTNPIAKATLYKRYYKTFDPGSVSTSSYEPDSPPKLNSKKFYLIKLDDHYVKAEAHKKNILKAFPEVARQQIKAYIGLKNFTFKGTDLEIEQELIQVVRYYNSL